MTFSNVSPLVQLAQDANVPQVVAPRHDEVSTSSRPRRSQRVSHPLDQFILGIDFVLLVDGGEPSYYKDTMLAKDHARWELAMKSELSSIEKNGTWELVPLPKYKKAVP